MIRLVNPPGIFPLLFPSILWHGFRDQKTIFLTFDDGPTPEATPYVLSALEKFNAKATFFCVGDNIRKNSILFQNLLKQGHSVGNHTFNHLNGWRVNDRNYVENVEQCSEIILAQGYPEPVTFFRPPFGKLGYGKYRKLKKKYRIVMWDVLTMDYNPGRNSSLLLKKIIRQTRNGSIVVFHDSLKSLPGLKILLEPFLHYFSEKGFRFSSLDEN